MSPHGAAPERPAVTIPAPTFNYLGPNDTPASTLRRVASNLCLGYEVGGGNVCEGLARICQAIASELEQQDPFDEDLGPDLLIQAGDCEFHGTCSRCRKHLGTVRPDQSLDRLGEAWDRHVNVDGCT